MDLELKICGVKDKENAARVMKFNPDYMGFIFYERSPRYVGGDPGWIASVDADRRIKKTGVFVNENTGEIVNCAQKAKLEVVQLHGKEPPADCRNIGKEGYEVIKVFSIGKTFTWHVLDPYLDCVDYFMFDTLGKYLGGNGVPFDWSLLEGYPFDKPFFLSGGIGPDNVANISHLKQSQLFAIDVNSRLESLPGVKDAGKLNEFMSKFQSLKHDRSGHGI